MKHTLKITTKYGTQEVRPKTPVTIVFPVVLEPEPGRTGALQMQGEFTINGYWDGESLVMRTDGES